MLRNGEDVSLRRPKYIYDISETKSEKVITIMKIDPSNPSSDMKSTIVFNWMDKSNSLVLSWQPDIKGSVLLAQSYQNDKDTYNWGIDDSGEKVKTNMLKPPVAMVTDPTKEEAPSIDENTEKSKWSEAIQYSYKATMTLVGIPCDIPIGMYIKVIPLLYGIPHNSAGLYMVLKSEDQIDSGGFVTTLNLMKIMTSDNYLDWKKS